MRQVQPPSEGIERGRPGWPLSQAHSADGATGSGWSLHGLLSTVPLLKPKCPCDRATSTLLAYPRSNSATARTFSKTRRARVLPHKLSVKRNAEPRQIVGANASSPGHRVTWYRAYAVTIESPTCQPGPTRLPGPVRVVLLAQLGQLILHRDRAARRLGTLPGFLQTSAVNSFFGSSAKLPFS